jgi:hypothetical protein
MRLELSGVNGSRVCAWGSYAVLRDNVQHFIECRARGQPFAAIHAFERAVDQGRVSIDASRLRAEVLRAQVLLHDKRAAEAAVSVRSHALMTGCRPPAGAIDTVLSREIGWPLPCAAPEEQPLLELAAAFVNSVLALTEASEDGDRLEVSFYRAPAADLER